MLLEDPRALQLTPHFRLSEFLRHEDPMPPPWVLDNIARLAQRLQAVRDILGKPMRLHSGYRTEHHNQSVGGAKRSLHLAGMAADVSVSGVAPAELQRLLKNWSGGMGLYANYTHLDIRPYRARWG
jgi:uncharacterized protein YcbK (DUF882 family)